MIAVIFEVTPKGDAERATSLNIATALRPLVEQIDGFVSVERFKSLTTSGKMLSVSVFRDQAAIDEWRRVMRHRAAQDAERHRPFADDRLRIAHGIRDCGMADRAEAPEDSRAING